MPKPKRVRSPSGPASQLFGFIFVLLVVALASVLIAQSYFPESLFWPSTIGIFIAILGAFALLGRIGTKRK